jgi:uncharacterized membrane protein YdfJ with MMPL/SSD domain
MNNTANNSSIWPIVLIVLGAAVVVQMIAGNNTTSSSSTTSSTNYPVDKSSLEYNYARGRFKQEGYSNADADTAARAVIKFNSAQKARSR